MEQLESIVMEQQDLPYIISIIAGDIISLLMHWSYVTFALEPFEM